MALQPGTVERNEETGADVLADALDVDILGEVLDPTGQPYYIYPDNEIAKLLSPIITDQTKLDQVIAFYAKMLASQPKNTDHQTQDNRDRIARLRHVINFIQSRWSHLRNQTN